MAYSTIPKGSLYMNTKLYAGNGNARSITGVGFQPDWVWIKNRTIAANHALFDVIRGATKVLNSNATTAEATEAQMLTAFGSDGFSVGTDSTVNDNGSNIVSWNWKANGAGSANTEGSVSATVSANTTAGFSIVQYNTNSSGTQTMGHGLDSAPTFIITKPALYSESWYVYIPTGVSTSLRLNTDAAAVSSTPYAGTPTDTLFSINNGVIGGYTDVISYCFADVKGYSKFGSYVGNSSTDGPFIYTGFKPAFVILKRTDGGDSWVMLDNKRNEYNPEDKILLADTSGVETTQTQCDFLSNGFKLRIAGGLANGNGNSHIYMAFAENPFVATSGTNAIPVTAR